MIRDLLTIWNYEAENEKAEFNYVLSQIKLEKEKKEKINPKEIWNKKQIIMHLRKKVLSALWGPIIYDKKNKNAKPLVRQLKPIEKYLHLKNIKNMKK